MESAVTRIQPPELKSAMGRSQLQLVSSRQNLSQPWDGVSRNSCPAAGTWVSSGTESAATRIQLPEPEPAIGWNQFVFFFYIYNLHFFEQKIYSHQVLIYLNVPGIPVRKPLQNRQIVSWRTTGCEFRGYLCKLLDWETFINEQKG